MQQAWYEGLPQRAPRQKRRRVHHSDDQPNNVTAAAVAKKNTSKNFEDTTVATVATIKSTDEEENGPTQQRAQEHVEEVKEDNDDHLDKDKDVKETKELPEEYRVGAVPGQNFEYLDHTADVQLHAWGVDLQTAFENVALCMFNYMTPIKDIEVKESRKYSATGHDRGSLLFHWLDELLFSFSTDFFVPREIKITKFDLEKLEIEGEGRGESFDRRRHASGTEIKAITYSAMQINEKEGDSEVFVIVDI